MGLIYCVNLPASLGEQAESTTAKKRKTVGKITFIKSFNNLDNTCVLIGQYKCVFIALWSTKVTWAIWLAVSKLWKFPFSWKKENYTFAHHILSCLSLWKWKFDKRKKESLFMRAFKAWWKPRKTLWEFSYLSRVFIDLLSNSLKRSTRLLKHGEYALFLNWLTLVGLH